MFVGQAEGIWTREPKAREEEGEGGEEEVADPHREQEEETETWNMPHRSLTCFQQKIHPVFLVFFV